MTDYTYTFGHTTLSLSSIGDRLVWSDSISELSLFPSAAVLLTPSRFTGFRPVLLTSTREWIFTAYITSHDRNVFYFEFSPVLKYLPTNLSAAAAYSAYSHSNYALSFLYEKLFSVISLSVYPGAL